MVLKKQSDIKKSYELCLVLMVWNCSGGYVPAFAVIDKCWRRFAQKLNKYPVTFDSIIYMRTNCILHSTSCLSEHYITISATFSSWTYIYNAWLRSFYNKQPTQIYSILLISPLSKNPHGHKSIPTHTIDCSSSITISSGTINWNNSAIVIIPKKRLSLMKWKQSGFMS